jgi:hypothetical protein
MRVSNRHQRQLRCSPQVAGSLLNRLASADDPLWPREQWPPMRFDGGLGEGQRGGHGPIRYWVERYRPGQSVRFRFSAPRGFVGTHELRVEADDTHPERCMLHHEIAMRVEGWARLSWPLVFGPLHDALLEDALDKAQRSVGDAPTSRASWSLQVRALRWLAARALASRRWLSVAALA